MCILSLSGTGMLAVAFISALSVVSHQSTAQSLVVNGGFEEENICTEYKMNCAPEGWIYTIASFGYYFDREDFAHKGKKFIGLIAGHSKKTFYRSAVRSRLLCALRKGNQYRVSLFIRSMHPVLDSFGIYFSKYDFLFEKTPLHKLKPAGLFGEGMRPPTSGDTGWQKIEIDYTADGTENFIAIGNFSRRDITGPTGVNLENHFFVFVDDVSFIPLHPGERLCDNRWMLEDEIYNQDERHGFQTRRVQFYRKQDPPPVTPATKTKLREVDTLIIPDILFATASAKPHAAFYMLLDSFSAKIMSQQIDSLVIHGHTDNQGGFDFNMRLSNDRALTVKDYLLAKTSLIPLQVITRGYGNTTPVAGNETPEGRQRNRRVEIYLYLRD